MKFNDTFTNIKNEKYNIKEMAFAKNDLYGNLGEFVCQTNRDNDCFFSPDDFDTEGVYIYKRNAQLALRVYKAFAEYKFNGNLDDRLISKLQQKQSNVKLTDFPTGVVTVDHRIIGQIIPYYNDYLTLNDSIYKHMVNEKNILTIYKKIIEILKELEKNNIIYTDNHAKNYMINNNLDVKLIDFEYSQIGIDDNSGYYNNLALMTLKNMINRLNSFLNIDFHIKQEMNLDNIFNEVSEYELKLKK